MWRFLIEAVLFLWAVGWVTTWVWWIAREFKYNAFPIGLQNKLSICLTKALSLFFTWPWFQVAWRNFG